MANINRANYSEFVNVNAQVTRIQELQAESMSVKTRDFAYQTELKLRGTIVAEIVKTDEKIIRNESDTEKSLAVEAAKAANKPKQTGTASSGTASTGASGNVNLDAGKPSDAATGATV